MIKTSPTFLNCEYFNNNYDDEIKVYNIEQEVLIKRIHNDDMFRYGKLDVIEAIVSKDNKLYKTKYYVGDKEDDNFVIGERGSYATDGYDGGYIELVEVDKDGNVIDDGKLIDEYSELLKKQKEFWDSYFN